MPHARYPPNTTTARDEVLCYNVLMSLVARLSERSSESADSRCILFRTGGRSEAQTSIGRYDVQDRRMHILRTVRNEGVDVSIPNGWAAMRMQPTYFVGKPLRDPDGLIVPGACLGTRPTGLPFPDTVFRDPSWSNSPVDHDGILDLSVSKGRTITALVPPGFIDRDARRVHMYIHTYIPTYAK